MQAGSSTHAYTPEQERIIASSARGMRVNAFAGTGKTSTLVGLSAARTGRRMLLVAFNKAIADEASRRFPGNVVARTGHSLGFRAIGVRYKDKLAGDLKPYNVASVLGSMTSSLPANVARVFEAKAIQAVKAFLVSADGSIGIKHVVLGGSPVEKKYLTEGEVAQGASRIWLAMQSMDSDVPMTHDGYLKLFQLTSPVLRFDDILLDEGQDTNPVMSAILSMQDSAFTIVGDTHQSIYAFRGAENAMELGRYDETHYLTGSFRFGQEVADVANAILGLKGERVSLRGLGRSSEIVKEPVINRAGWAFISRTNSAVFDRADWAIKRKTPALFVGGVDTYKFEVGEDIAKLALRGPSAVRNPMIASFENLSALAEYAEAVDDVELKGWAKTVERFSPARFLDAARDIRAAAITYDSDSPLAREGQVFVTAHRSKGLEFDHVELADNFVDTVDEEGGLKSFDAARGASKKDIEEVNLLYVAATRARKRLAINTSIANVLVPAVEHGASAKPR